MFTGYTFFESVKTRFLDGYVAILSEISESVCNFRTFYFNIYFFCKFAAYNI